MSVAFSVWCGGSGFIFLGRTSLISRAQKVVTCTTPTSRIVSRFNLARIVPGFNPVGNCETSTNEGEGTEPDFAGTKGCDLYNPHFANCVQIQSGVAEKGFFDIIKVLDEKERKRAWESRLK